MVFAKQTYGEIVLIIKNEENVLGFGDNKMFLQKIAPDFLGKVNCIYIDPPYAKNSDFLFKDGRIAYSDKITGTNFIEGLKERLLLSKPLLKEDGLVWIHMDWTICHYVKIMLDEIFGNDCFINEVIVKRTQKNDSGTTKRINVGHDVIYVYGASKNSRIKPVFKEIPEKEPYWHAFDAKGPGGAKSFGGTIISPPEGNHWRWSQERIDREWANGTLRLNPKTGQPQYLVEAKKMQKLDTLWTDIQAYSFKTGYPTEKSQDLLKRIITASTEPGDYVMDFYAGSGSTGEASMTLGRKYILCDRSPEALPIIKKRLGVDISEDIFSKINEVAG